jgi:C_GCAxxG_C_C family probable redox protein
VQEKLGTKNDDLIKAMDSFGGGLGAHGEICGAVIGGLAAIGLIYGRSEPGHQTDVRMWKHSRMFMKRFRNEVTDGKILCRDLVNVDWTDFNQAKSYQGSDKFEYCLMLTGRTAKLIGEILDKAQAE